MTDHDKGRADAAKLPEGDVVAVLQTQHAPVGDMLDLVTNSTGDQRQQSFTALAGLLTAQETAEVPEEFPTIIANGSPEQRHALSHQFLAAFAGAGGRP